MPPARASGGAAPGTPNATVIAETVLRRTVALGCVPAPTLHERERAHMVAGWWRADGLAEVRGDKAGNVWACLRRGRSGGTDPGATLVCAHLDTVFAESVDHTVRREGDLLCGPGVGDDTVAVAALAALDHLLPAETVHPVWILATVGEEGRGNLAGITAALDEPRTPIRAVIAVEGNYLGRVCRVGVGSVRWRVGLEGPGGHAWEAADAPSAIHAAGHIIAALDRLARPSEARTSLNIGILGGGEAINARARHAAFELDVRADDGPALDDLADSATDSIEALAAHHRVRATLEEVGRRPAGSVPEEHPLVRRAAEALRAIGYNAKFTAASTDANAAYARGIPAVTVGVTEGGGEHTPGEWIRISPLGDGLLALGGTVTAHDAGDRDAGDRDAEDRDAEDRDAEETP